MKNKKKKGCVAEMRIKGAKLYSIIKDEELLLVGADLKSIWRNGQITDEKEFVLILFYFEEGEWSPNEIHVKIPYTVRNEKMIRDNIGNVIGSLSNVFDIISPSYVMLYEGMAKSNYVIVHANDFSPEIRID